jgi:hypothetical protein
MGKLIYIENYQSMDTRIRVMRKLFRAEHGSFLEALPTGEKLKRDGQEIDFPSRVDNEADKLAKLALNTARSMRDEEDDL